MSECLLSNDFKSIVLHSTPLIDVRAPIEFEKGSFPHAVNLPLINDKERHEIGICYKNYGNEEAVKLGFRLVSGKQKEERIQAWQDYIAVNPHAKLFCFRGGQRSRISQEWISQSGHEITRLKGGYKAFRNYLLNAIEEAPRHFKPLILGGRTGSGKTILLKNLPNSIDFEGLANHRGSSFGRQITPQPSQINFENALAYDLTQKLDKGFPSLVFEDEGKRIGGVYIPKTFADYLADAPLIILETPLQERVDITFNEYVLEAQKVYENARYEDGLKEWKNSILGAMDRIKKRLGMQRYQQLYTLFDNALFQQIKSGSADAHKEWIIYLLKEYYDPMYDYQIQKRSTQVQLRASSTEILSYLHSN